MTPAQRSTVVVHPKRIELLELLCQAERFGLASPTLFATGSIPASGETTIESTQGARPLHLDGLGGDPRHRGRGGIGDVARFELACEELADLGCLGFVPTDYRHPVLDGVYAVAMASVRGHPVPVNFPKTGHINEQMAQIAARDIAARIEGREGGAAAELSARCMLDMGDRGASLAVDPVRPPRNAVSTGSEGRQWLLAKRAFEHTYVWHTKRDRRMPTTLGW